MHANACPITCVHDQLDDQLDVDTHVFDASYQHSLLQLRLACLQGMLVLLVNSFTIQCCSYKLP